MWSWNYSSEENLIITVTNQQSLKLLFHSLDNFSAFNVRFRWTVFSAPEPCEAPSVQSEGIPGLFVQPCCAGLDWSSLCLTERVFFFSCPPQLRINAMMFRDQVSVLTDWFKGWNECEQTVALLSLLKRVSRTQARFLHICLEHWLADCTEIHILEAEANNAGS